MAIRIFRFTATHRTGATDHLESVREPESCVYEFTVYSKRLCSVPYFRKEELAPSLIRCNPIAAASDKDKVELVNIETGDMETDSRAELRTQKLPELIQQKIAKDIAKSESTQPFLVSEPRLAETSKVNM